MNNPVPVPDVFKDCREALDARWRYVVAAALSLIVIANVAFAAPAFSPQDDRRVGQATVQTAEGKILEPLQSAVRTVGTNKQKNAVADLEPGAQPENALIGMLTVGGLVLLASLLIVLSRHWDKPVRTGASHQSAPGTTGDADSVVVRGTAIGSFSPPPGLRGPHGS